MTDKILQDVLKFIERNTRFPTEQDMKKLGYTRAMIRTRFGSATMMKQILLEETSIPNYITEENFNDEYDTELKARIKGKKTFLISSFVCGTKVNKRLWGNLQVLAKYYKAEILLLPILDKQNKGDRFFDPELIGTNVITDEFYLNSNLLLSNISVGARSTDPSSGLPRLGQRNGSTIVASTKQRLKYVPTGLHTLPHAIMSTGTITDPLYSTSRLFKNKAAKIAEEDHKFGAIVVEIKDDTIFHFRHIEAGPQMELIDLGVMVKGGKLSKVKPAALVLGDWHSGKTNEAVANATTLISKKLHIDRWILHDVFDGDSINHHEEGKHITRAKKVKATGLSIKTELRRLASDLAWMSSFLKDIVVVRSNHDLFLDLYLNKCLYVDDPHNHELALELSLAMFSDYNPLQYGTEKHLKGSVKSKLTWLKEDQSYKIAGIECGVHGHRGASGARPSIASIENAYKKAVTGHTHTPQILRDVFVVGTSTDNFPDYGHGPNSWMQTHCIVYSNGTRQLINLIEGKFTTLL